MRYLWHGIIVIGLCVSIYFFVSAGIKLADMKNIDDVDGYTGVGYLDIPPRNIFDNHTAMVQVANPRGTTNHEYGSYCSFDLDFVSTSIRGTIPDTSLILVKLATEKNDGYLCADGTLFITTQGYYDDLVADIEHRKVTTDERIQEQAEQREHELTSLRSVLETSE